MKKWISQKWLSNETNKKLKGFALWTECYGRTRFCMVIEFQTDSGIVVLCVPTFKLKAPQRYMRDIYKTSFFSDIFVANVRYKCDILSDSKLSNCHKSLVLLMYCYNVSLSPWSFPETLYISWGNIWWGNWLMITFLVTTESWDPFY